MELSSFMIKKFLIFLEMELSSLIFLQCFRKYNFPSSKNEKKTTHKKLLIFWEIEPSSLSIKNFLIFQEELPKPEK